MLIVPTEIVTHFSELFSYLGVPLAWKSIHLYKTNTHYNYLLF